MDNQTAVVPYLLNKKKEARLIAFKAFDLLDVSENTRTDYKYRIGKFIDFTIKQGINNNSYLEYKRYLQSRTDWSISTKNKYLAAASNFLKELHRQGTIPVDVTQNIKGFTQQKKHKKDGLSQEEIGRLTSTLRELPPTPQNTRLKAIVALLALQGLRQIEITRLDVSDIDLRNNTALILGKGRDDKESIDLHPETVKAVKEYIKINKIAAGVLFPSLSNNHKNQRLTTRALREIVKQALKSLGIEKTVHGFRHYFTTTLIKTYKGDLLEVSQYTRHRGLEMLQVYNDQLKRKEDLPRYYAAFEGVNF